MDGVVVALVVEEADMPILSINLFTNRYTINNQYIHNHLITASCFHLSCCE